MTRPQRMVPWGRLTLAALALSTAALAQAPTAEEARALAKEAYIYGFPLVDSYRIQHAYFVNRSSPEYKASYNVLTNIPRVYTPADRAVQTPNSDTPYSMIGMDLRAEPLVLTVPPIEARRYFSIQLVDAYTHNFDYLGSRTTGNGGGRFLVAGPRWKGEIPAGITKSFRAETDLVLGIYRTQLFDAADLENVKKIQAGYRVQLLSEFLGKPAPAPAPAIDFVAPLTPAEQKSSLRFFDVLSFVLGFCPTVESERDLRSRFARIGVGAGRNLEGAGLSPELKQAVADGMADAWQELAGFQTSSIATGKVTSGDLFGTREALKNNYLYRFAAAVLGIFGNSQQEAMYPFYTTDEAGAKLDASKSAYTLRFGPDGLPPVHAFWSVTMYEQPASLLVANPIGRYLINSSMLPKLKRDADGGLTIYIQAESPGAERESNWLPAPNGPFSMAMRLYWPKAEALDGRWKPPAVRAVERTDN